ncbi:unnamed protein product [Caretta caretta]
MFSEILKASAASDHEKTVWRVSISDCMKKEKVDMRKAKESQQEEEREMHQDIMELFQQQTQTLQTHVNLQVQQSWACLPLQFMENCTAAHPYTLLNIPRGIRGHIPTSTTPTTTREH